MRTDLTHSPFRTLNDLVLGVRLAVGGGRTSWARLILGTIGIGLAVAVLLLAAAAPHAIGERNHRARAGIPVDTPIAGVDPLYTAGSSTSFRGRSIMVDYVSPGGPRTPLPPGLGRIPAPGEVVVSPELAGLLAGPDGALLRPRFPGHVTGTIGQEGLHDPHDIEAYIGADSSLRKNPVYAFGAGSRTPEPLPRGLLALLIVGMVSLLSPVLVFITTSARIAGAARDRRLAAIRLTGADSRQARRIAAAESLVAGATGLIFGAGLFLLARQVAPDLQIRGTSVFTSDLTPAWPLVVLIVLCVPVISVLTALVALRGTVIEPLGVVRQARRVRRRLSWRLLMVAAGVVLLLTAQLTPFPDIALTIGIALPLLGIPALLPWLVELAVARWRGGRPSLQLAVRRLQSDSGTAARVIGGTAVVLAGAIAAQALLAGQSSQYQLPDAGPESRSTVIMDSDGQYADAALNTMRGVPGVRAAYQVREVAVEGGVHSKGTVGIADCATLHALYKVDGCRDGMVYTTQYGAGTVTTGQNVRLSTEDAQKRTLGTWLIPQTDRVTVDDSQPVYSDSLLATPGALSGLDLRSVPALQFAYADSGNPDFAEQARNAMAPFAWHISLYVPGEHDLTAAQRSYQAIRNGLLGGSIFTLLLAGVSLLVLALEHLRERRRSIAALSATGVPLGVLARSLVWQNTIPLLVGMLVAVGTGTGLAALTFRLIRDPVRIDWPAVGYLCAAAAAVTLLMTALTLPSLRSATRLPALRME